MLKKITSDIMQCPGWVGDDDDGDDNGDDIYIMMKCLCVCVIVTKNELSAGGAKRDAR